MVYAYFSYGPPWWEWVWNVNGIGTRGVWQRELCSLMTTDITNDGCSTLLLHLMPNFTSSFKTWSVSSLNSFIVLSFKDRTIAIILSFRKLCSQIMHTHAVMWVFPLQAPALCLSLLCRMTVQKCHAFEDVFISVILLLSSWACKGRVWARRQGSVTAMSFVWRCHRGTNFVTEDMQ